MKFKGGEIFNSRRKLITVEEIIEIHEEIVRRYGGESGILNKGELEFIVDQINHSSKSSLFWKVAILMRGIISGHPFVDGNKRTGFEVAYIILSSHGYDITASDDLIKEFLIELAMEEKHIYEIVKWLKYNTKKSLYTMHLRKDTNG